MSLRAAAHSESLNLDTISSVTSGKSSGTSNTGNPFTSFVVS